MNAPANTTPLPATVLGSMTAFARVAGTVGNWSFTWELRSVNGKGLDLRLRLPIGFDDMEPEVRKRAAKVLSRGSVTATLTAIRQGEQMVARVNENALSSLLQAVQVTAQNLGTAVPTIDTLLTIKGIVEVTEVRDSESDRIHQVQSFLEAFDEALKSLRAMRAREGAVLGVVLTERLEDMADLLRSAEDLRERGIESIKARLSSQVKLLLDTAAQLDPIRLHQEAVLAATRADIREELDRLGAHVSAARELLSTGGPVGRKLDFLAQEFHREANTLCSKSNAVSLTKIGLDLKVLVDQFREQVQNLE